MATKIRAGRYSVATTNGEYTIKKIAHAEWIVLNDQSRKVGPKFPTLRSANLWVSCLENRPASDKSKNYLRDLLAAQKGSELAEQIRSYFNDKRSKGVVINQGEVSLAIKRLTNPVQVAAARALPAPREAVEPFANRAEAIEFARAAVSR